MKAGQGSGAGWGIVWGATFGSTLQVMWARLEGCSELKSERPIGTAGEQICRSSLTRCWSWPVVTCRARHTHTLTHTHTPHMHTRTQPAPFVTHTHTHTHTLHPAQRIKLTQGGGDRVPGSPPHTEVSPDSQLCASGPTLTLVLESAPRSLALVSSWSLIGPARPIVIQS